MTSTDETGAVAHAPLLTENDEMGLSGSQARQTDESVPDTLEVRSDATSVLQSSMEPMRRPALIAVAVVGGIALVILAGGLLGRLTRRDRA